MFPYGIGHVPDSDPPPGLDWDFYLGPAPKVPFNKSRFLRYFRWFWDYAGGWITDFGTHRLDTVQQVMGVEAPLSVNASGNRFTLKDDGHMPDVLQVTYEYPGFVNGHGLGGRLPGMKYYSMRGQNDRPHGEAFYGTNGALLSDRIGFEIQPEPKADLQARIFIRPADRRRRASGSKPGRFNPATPPDLHVKNFIECVRSRQKPNADVSRLTGRPPCHTWATSVTKSKGSRLGCSQGRLQRRSGRLNAAGTRRTQTVGFGLKTSTKVTKVHEGLA